MTDEELLAELATRKALIVHCSRPGKGDEGIGGLLFPKDLQNAIEICATQSKELCCSVVWPGHTETFGAIGILLKPRSTKSITSICTTDGGTYLDPSTGRRAGMGSPFSKQAVLDTFTKATSYNEWSVVDADTVGIFAHPSDSWEVARKVSLKDIPGYQPWMGDEETVELVQIGREEIETQFPNLPIYTFAGSDIVRLGNTGPVSIRASALYGLADGEIGSTTNVGIGFGG